MFAAEMLRALCRSERVATVDFIASDAALRVMAEELNSFLLTSERIDWRKVYNQSKPGPSDDHQAAA